MAGRACLFQLGFILCFLIFRAASAEPKLDEDDAIAYLNQLNDQYSIQCNTEMLARWDYMVDVTNTEKETAATAASVEYMSFQGEAAKNCSTYDYESFEDIDIYRQYRFLSIQGPGALPEEDLQQYNDLQSRMENTYSAATICDCSDPSICGLELEPDIETIMATSRDFVELQCAWEEWRDATGTKMRQDFLDFVALSNQAAKLDGFSDTSEYWLDSYTVTDREAESYGLASAIDQTQFRSQTETIWNEVSSSLYKKLHTYVRWKLSSVYPDYIDLKGPMPANILGNMWAQDWTNIGDLVMPYPEFPSYDVTDSMVENGWTIDRMFESAEDFFVSIGLDPMSSVFWDKSVINQTEWGKVMLCHASAEDFCMGATDEDWRIKMCTSVNMEDLVTVHHEMGHIEYFMQYKGQPFMFRNGANPGFHEAIGDLIALSVSTPSHMESILGLNASKIDSGVQNDETTDDVTDDEKKSLNFLMRMALEKVAFLPFGYLIDAYRWGVFDGSITEENLNAAWWQLREDLQGVTPPGGARGEEYFDAGAKYHVPANVPYIRYFVSFIVQFQFHQHLCSAAGFEGDLSECDIYANTDAGDILRTNLEKGFSRPWPTVLSDLGGSYDMDAAAITSYFQPLIDYLDSIILQESLCVGWGTDCDATDVRDPTDEAQALIDINAMEDEMQVLIVAASEAEWTEETDHTDEHAAAANEAAAQANTAYLEYWQTVINFYEYEGFTDPELVRRFKLQSKPGTAALDATDQAQLSDAITEMSSYSLNNVCPANNKDCDAETEGYNIDNLELQMAISRSWDDLEYYWKSWRDVAAKPAKPAYLDYVDLMNKAAQMPENNYTDAGEMWLQPYESGDDYTTTDFKNDIEDLWNQTQSLYYNLHAYVRYKLRQSDPYNYQFAEDSPIPAHILGNMYAQEWQNIYDLVVPFPDVDLVDITSALQDNSTVDEMFAYAEDFFVKTGLFPMTEDFKAKSMKEQPEGKIAVCHASAWDFYSIVNPQTDGDYRIKMCTDKNQDDFITIHHEMGHIEYFMSYSQDPEVNPDTGMADVRPLVFRNGANPGFHEAIGDTIALSVQTNEHLQKLYKTITGNDYDTGDTNATQLNINQLMKTALSKVAFIPYAYILDKWRWDVFAGEYPDDQLNYYWWKMRVEVQGVKPPILRYRSEDFDVASKYHVTANVPYIRYFVSYILQFQFHEELCSVAFPGDSVALNECDIYGQPAAGEKLEQLLAKGMTEDWQEQLAWFLDSDGKMDASAILEYFKPLNDWLIAEIEEHNIPTDLNRDVDKYFREDIPPIVPIVVGIVLLVMIGIVIVAYVLGKRNQDKKNKLAEAVEKGGELNQTFDMEEKRSEAGSIAATK